MELGIPASTVRVSAWVSPSSKGLEPHFDGVDGKGHVCYSHQIAELDLGSDLKLPLIINFRSDRESSSTCFGKGWVLPLLESNIVQTAEDVFLMTQPDGWVRHFYRRNHGDTVLDGGPGLYSARWGGHGLDDAGRNALMLERLRGVPAERRTARYRCVIALPQICR